MTKSRQLPNVLAALAVLTLSACSTSDEKSASEMKMGELGRDSTKSDDAGGGTRNEVKTHRAESSDGVSSESQGTTGSATVTTHNTATVEVK